MDDRLSGPGTDLEALEQCALDLVLELGAGVLDLVLGLGFVVGPGLALVFVVGPGLELVVVLVLGPEL